MGKGARPEIEYQPGDDLPSKVRKFVEKKPDKTAYVFKGKRTSWGELGAGINRAANSFIALGVGRGSRVAILSRNSVTYVEAFFGALAAGACAVPLPTMASPEALRLMIEDSKPKALFISSEYIDAMAPFISGFDFINQGAMVGLDFGDETWVEYERWIKDASDQAPGVVIGRDDEFHIIYSSGTTGAPKGIIHSHGNRVAFVTSLGGLFAQPGLVNIISTPLYSHTTMVTWLTSMSTGTTCVLMDKFDARKFLELCEKEKATTAMLVPVQYDRILRVEDYDSFDLSSLIVKLCTSAPLHEDMKRKIIDRMPGELVEFYGLTEGGVSTVFVGSRDKDHLDSVGKLADGCEARIIDEAGNELPPGQTGELVGRNKVMMSGYLNRDEATDEMLWRDKDGGLFYRSGDMGRMDEQGYLYISGRKKEVIISGGFNIFAVDLESELMKHDAVTDAAVIAVPSEKWGETPLAFVVLEDNSKETAEGVLDWVNQRLGKSQRISKIEIRDELPKCNIGKTLKKELRKPYWEDHGVRSLNK